MKWYNLDVILNISILELSFRKNEVIVNVRKTWFVEKNQLKFITYYQKILKPANN